MQFKPEMVRAIAEGKKTQTRRLIDPDEDMIKDGRLGRAVTYREGSQMYPEWETTYIPRARLKVGGVYAVQSGQNQHGLWVCRPDNHGTVVFAHECHDLDSTATIWDKAHTVPFYSSGKPEPESYLRNNGFDPLRIRILDIQEEEDVRHITHPNAVAEGFRTVEDFLEAWTQLHDKGIVKRLHQLYRQGVIYLQDPADTDLSEYWALLNSRPAERYGPVAVITFEVARDV